MKKFISIFFISGFILSNILTLVGQAKIFSPQEPVLTASFAGIIIYPQASTKPEFLIDYGNAKLNKSQKESQFNKLSHLFHDALSIPQRHIWVDPYQKSKNIPQDLGKTELGQNLLDQAYLLKKLSFSLHDYYKTWIVPDKAVLYHKGNTFLIREIHLKIMVQPSAKAHVNNGVLLKLEKEVNEGKDFNQIRQLYSAIVLAQAYKQQIAQQKK